MDIEVSPEAKDKRLNRLVAITVVVLSVFSGLCGIKDGNIVQNMQQAQVTSIDRWNEYQATRTKLHLAQASREQIALLSPTDCCGLCVRCGLAANQAFLTIGAFERREREQVSS